MGWKWFLPQSPDPFLCSICFDVSWNFYLPSIICHKMFTFLAIVPKPKLYVNMVAFQIHHTDIHPTPCVIDVRHGGWPFLHTVWWMSGVVDVCVVNVEQSVEVSSSPFFVIKIENRTLDVGQPVSWSNLVSVSGAAANHISKRWPINKTCFHFSPQTGFCWSPFWKLGIVASAKLLVFSQSIWQCCARMIFSIWFPRRSPLSQSCWHHYSLRWKLWKEGLT